jgi:hypothetical protein
VEHYVHIAADSERALEASPDTVGALEGSGGGDRRAVWRHGTIAAIISCSASATISPSIGIEHHESSDDRDFERALIDPELLKGDGSLCSRTK